MSIISNVEIRINHELHKDAHDRAEYQVIGFARWMLQDDRLRRLPRVIPAHISLCERFLEFSKARMDRVPLNIVKYESNTLIIEQQKTLERADLMVDGMYEYGLNHFRALSLYDGTRSQYWSITAFFAPDIEEMQAYIEPWQQSLTGEPAWISYDHNTNRIFKMVQNVAGAYDREFYTLMNDVYIPDVPTGHEPLLAWVNADVSRV